MPFLICSNCKSQFHVSIREKPDEWNKKFPNESDGNRYSTCFLCFKLLKENDVVEVWDIPSDFSGIDKGDKGTIVCKYDDNNFEVECVNEDGTSKWLHTIHRDYLWYVWP